MFLINLLVVFIFVCTFISMALIILLFIYYTKEIKFLDNPDKEMTATEEKIYKFLDILTGE